MTLHCINDNRYRLNSAKCLIILSIRHTSLCILVMCAKWLFQSVLWVIGNALLLFFFNLLLILYFVCCFFFYFTFMRCNKLTFQYSLCFIRIWNDLINKLALNHGIWGCCNSLVAMRQLPAHLYLIDKIIFFKI